MMDALHERWKEAENELIEHLMDPILEDYGDAVRNELGVYLPAIDNSLDRFSEQLAFCARNEILFPCLLLPEHPVPINWRVFEPSPQSTRYALAYSSGRDPVGTAGFSLKEAAGFFHEGLKGFLGQRYRGIKLDPPAPPSGLPTPGRLFPVHAWRDGEEVSGLRVHISKAYHIDVDPPVFGAPSSPAEGYIQAGTWKFGVYRTEKRAVVLDPTGLFGVPEVSRADIYI